MTEIRSRRSRIMQEQQNEFGHFGYTRERLARQMGIALPSDREHSHEDHQLVDSKEKRDGELLSYVGAYAGISLERMRQLFTNKKELNIDKLATFILNLAATNEFKQSIVAVASDGRNIDVEGYVRNFETKRHPPYLEPISPVVVARVVEQIIDYEENELFVPATAFVSLLTQLVPIHQAR